MEKQIRLSGSGGQGVITAGIILAEAALLDGKNAIQTQSYGPEARGGASKAEVKISSEEIDYPKVIDPDVVLALTPEAAMKYTTGLKKDGVVILDSTIDWHPADFAGTVYRVPIINIARDELKKPIVSNIVALGALVGLTNLVSREAVEKAVLARVPKGTEELNKKALQAGFAAADKVR